MNDYKRELKLKKRRSMDRDFIGSTKKYDKRKNFFMNIYFEGKTKLYKTFLLCLYAIRLI